MVHPCHFCLFLLSKFVQGLPHLPKVFQEKSPHTHTAQETAIRKDLLDAGELSSVSVIDDELLYVNAENLDGLHPRATHPYYQSVF